MTTDAKTKIAVARSKLRDKYPFFGVLASELNIGEDKTGRVDTACVSKYGNMLYNTIFVESLSFDETMGVIAHESLHVVFEFWDRIGTRFFNDANLAHDFVINLIITKAGLKMPKGVALDNAYTNMSFEEVYEKLPQSRITYVLLGDVDQSLGSLADKEFPFSINKCDETKDSDNNDKWRSALMRALKADKDESKHSIRGSLPSSIQMLIDEIMYPPIPFSKRLQKYIGQWGRKSQATFRRFNKMNSFDTLHTTFPSYKANRGRAYLLLDTSGSMFCGNNKKLISHGLGCIESIATSIGMDIVIVTCDAKLQQRMSLRDFKAMVGTGTINLAGGGGSDFREAFIEIWKEISQLMTGAPIICFTDGDILVNEYEPKIKTETIWITQKNQKPPTIVWGSHCPLDISA